MFIWRKALIAFGCLALSACSFHSGPPPFTASGYIADDGVVRLWRKDDSSEGVHLMMAFTPLRDGHTTLSEYHWQGEQLTSLEVNITGRDPEQVKLRFDTKGNVSFMQRQLQGQKQQLSTDSIAMYQYRAGQVRSISDALRSGRVKLYQGRWQPGGKVLTCEGTTIAPALDSFALSKISSRQSHSAQAVSVAWLEAPEGTQLLLIENEDVCGWQPKADTF
ncbi:membrane protein [Salmonella enterica subsp. enterica serovar Choleraesuis]|nr:membrane protein [Salmonella enterica subsp. enterica serovar Choleraesuis]